MEAGLLGISGAHIHHYDALSRQTSQEDFALIGGSLLPISTVNYQHSPAGDRTQMSTLNPALGVLTYQHDPDHLLTQITHTTTSPQVHTFTHDPGMRQKTHTLPNLSVETRNYDGKERLQQLLTRTSLNATLSDLG